MGTGKDRVRGRPTHGCSLVAARLGMTAASEAWGLQRAWPVGSHYHYLLTTDD